MNITRYREILKEKVNVIYNNTVNEYNSIKLFNEQQRKMYFEIFKREIPKEIQLTENSLKDMLKGNLIEIVTFYNLQTNRLVIKENKCTFEDIMKNIDNILLECLERITYNSYNNSYSIKFTSRRDKRGYLGNKTFIYRAITFLLNIKGSNIELKEFNNSNYDFIKNDFIPFKKYRVTDNVSFKTFKKRNCLTIYFDK